MAYQTPKATLGQSEPSPATLAALVASYGGVLEVDFDAASPSAGGNPEDRGVQALGEATTVGSVSLVPSAGGLPAYWDYPGSSNNLHQLAQTGVNVSSGWIVLTLTQINTGFQYLWSHAATPRCNGGSVSGTMRYRWSNNGECNTGEAGPKWHMPWLVESGGADTIREAKTGASGAPGGYSAHINLSSGTLWLGGQSLTAVANAKIARHCVVSGIVDEAAFRAAVRSYFAALFPGMGW